MYYNMFVSIFILLCGIADRGGYGQIQQNVPEVLRIGKSGSLSVSRNRKERLVSSLLPINW